MTTEVPVFSSGTGGYPQSRRDKYMLRTGAIAETVPRWMPLKNDNAVFGSTGATNSLFLFAITLPANRLITTVTFKSGATPGNAMTHQWFGLTDNAYGVLRKTNDDTNTAWAANTEKTLTLASSGYTTTYEGLHYLILAVCATSALPNMLGFVHTEATTLNAAPFLSSAGDAVSDPASLGSTVTPSTGTARHTWAYVS